MRGLLFLIGEKTACVILFFLLAIPSLPVHAQTIPGFNQISTNPYIVDDLPISINADNAVNAREKAFEQALQTGFTIMIERLYPDVETRAAIKTPSTPELGRMLQDFSTRDEQVGPKQYAATFQLRFRQGRVQKYLQPSGTALNIPSTETPVQTLPQTAPQTPASTTLSSQQILVLPFLQTANGPVLWTAANPLRDALSTSSQSQTTPIILPLGDDNDRQILNDISGIRATPESLRVLMTKYQTNRALMIVAVPDTMDVNTQPTKMTLMFYGSSIVNPTPDYLDSIVASIDNASTLTDASTLFTRAAQNIQSQISTLTSRINTTPKEQEIFGGDPMVSAALTTVSGSSNPNIVISPLTSQELTDPLANVTPIGAVITQTIQPSGATVLIPVTDIQNPTAPLFITENGVPMIVRFNTMTEWNDIRTRIKSIPGVITIRITKLKAQEATIDIVTTPAMTGNPAMLQTGLNARGLALNINTSGIPILTRGTVPAPTAAPTMDTPESSYDFTTSSREVGVSRAVLNGQ